MKLKNAIGGRHRKAARPGQGVVIDGDVGRVSIEDIDEGGLRTARSRADWRVISAAPFLDGEEREPIGRITAVNVADHQVGLDRLAGDHAGAFLDAAIDKIGFALVQNNVSGSHWTGTIRINGHRRAVLGRHYKKADVLKQFIGQVLPHRAEVVGAVINRG